MAVTVLMAGCVGSASGGGGDPTASPTSQPSQGQVTQFYLRAWQTQALAPQYTFAWLPQVTIADGKYIDGQVAVPAIFPGPLWIGPSVRTITPTGIAAILAEARTQGLLGDTSDFSDQQLAGGVTAHVEMIVEGKTYELTGNPDALERCMCTPVPGTDAAFAAFWQKLSGLNAWMPDQLGDSQSYAPTRLAVMAAAPSADTSGITPTEVAWPLTTPFATFGTAMGNEANRCAVVEGTDLATLLPVVQNSNQLTRFKDSAGTVDSLQVRVLVPGEPSPCG